MATRAQIAELLELGHSYESAGRALHIPAGQAFMIATGIAADGSGAPAPEELREKPVLAGSSQHLVNPPPFNPTRSETVTDWVKQRAERDLLKGG